MCAYSTLLYNNTHILVYVYPYTLILYILQYTCYLSYSVLHIYVFTHAHIYIEPEPALSEEDRCFPA